MSDDDEQRRKLLTKEQERDVLESTEIIDLLKAKADKKKNKNKTINYEESSIPHRQMRSKCVCFMYFNAWGHHVYSTYTQCEFVLVLT